MFTIFGMPKSFNNSHIAVIQRNAIKSWTKLEPECEVILFGDDTGTAEVAQQLNVRHIPKVERNQFGTPLVSSLFNIAMEVSKTDILAYVNSDMILMSDFAATLKQVSLEPSFLLVGLKWELDVRGLIDFDAIDWEDQLRRRLAATGKMDKEFGGSDYFAFRKGMWGEIPRLALGRYVWDNWLIYRAQVLNATVINATPVITAVHQTHDYNHHPQGQDGVKYSLETWNDFQAVGGLSQMSTLFDVSLIMTRDRFKELEMTEDHLRHMEVSHAFEADWATELQRRHASHFNGKGEAGGSS